MIRNNIVQTGAALALVMLASPAVAQSDPPPVAVEPEAVQALQRMSVFLGTLPMFEVKAQSSLDVVLLDGQRVQVDGATTYRVRRPNGFVIETVTAQKSRQFIYDGRQLTVYAPQLGYYAQVPAPTTIRATLDAAYDNYGIILPLEDLFSWSDPAERAAELDSGFVVGDALVDGVETRQYAFRQGPIDWQIWIQKGDQPIPRKVVIVDSADEDRPAFTARLSWNLRPAYKAEVFAFKPGATAKAIKISDASN